MLCKASAAHFHTSLYQMTKPPSVDMMLYRFACKLQGHPEGTSSLEKHIGVLNPLSPNISSESIPSFYKSSNQGVQELFSGWLRWQCLGAAVDPPTVVAGSRTSFGPSYSSCIGTALGPAVTTAMLGILPGPSHDGNGDVREPFQDWTSSPVLPLLPLEPHLTQ